MPYNLSCCGVGLKTARDSVEEEPAFTQEAVGYSNNGQHYDEFTTRKRVWRARSVFVATSEAPQYRGLVEGAGHTIKCDGTVATGKGIAAELASAYTLAGTGGQHGPKVTVTSGGTLGWELADRMEMPVTPWAPTHGFTLLFFRKEGADVLHHVAKGALAVTRGADANPVGLKQWRDGVAGSFGMGNFLDLSAGGRVRVTGHATDGSPAAREYSSLVVLPFEVPDDWIADLVAFHTANEWPRLRSVMICGRAIEGGSVLARVRATRLPQRGIVRDGTFDDTARLFELQISEV